MLGKLSVARTTSRGLDREGWSASLATRNNARRAGGRCGACCPGALAVGADWKSLVFATCSDSGLDFLVLTVCESVFQRSNLNP